MPGEDLARMSYPRPASLTGALLSLCWLAAGCTVPPPAGRPASAATSRVVVGGLLPSNAEVRALLVRRMRNNGVGLVVGVIDARGRRVVAHGKSGAADQRPLDGDTIFQIGSITKVFTGLLLADMIQRGEVTLDDPAGRYLPPGVAIPVVGRPVTLFDLATHRSGLPSMPTFALDGEPDPYAAFTVDQLHAFLSSHPPVRPPGGARGYYSNLGVALLGRLLAHRTGTEYEALLRDRLLAPLGMTSTAIRLAPEQRRRLAPGHDAYLRPVATWELVTLPASGSLRSTANDLLRFLAAELGYDRTPLAAAMRFQWTTRQPPGGQAIGWGVTKVNGDEIVRHEGGKEGYRAAIAFNPRARTGIVVLANARTGDSPMDLAMHLLTGRALPAATFAPTPPPRVTLERAQLDACAGRYRLASGTALQIARRGDTLVVQAEGGGASPYVADGALSFSSDSPGERLRFEAGPDGRITRLVLRSDGADTPAERITDP
jgi:D-alanyl-D-alanine-carboxypeptidase/D-alanyl-D-alanine-endopeptidase